MFLGYELAREIEPNLTLPPTPLPWQAFALRTHGALVLDLERGRVSAVAGGDPKGAAARAGTESENRD